jgi:8-oxo-dGTP pyrophosphatase MutT (NUDIX family)
MRKPFSRAFPQATSNGLPVQVAAVCYRVRGHSVEFLLVNTSAGKWTFPKGRIEPGLSGSESAAREALEEAGAIGEIEAVHFGSYLDAKRITEDNRVREILIAAYLFEVHSRVTPEEKDRNPTWFTALEAKKKLSELRAGKYSAQLAALVEVAERYVIETQGPFLVRTRSGSRRIEAQP